MSAALTVPTVGTYIYAKMKRKNKENYGSVGSMYRKEFIRYKENMLTRFRNILYALIQNHKSKASDYYKNIYFTHKSSQSFFKRLCFSHMSGKPRLFMAAVKKTLHSSEWRITN